jgi:alkyldihydroxyacetonephosphate synthase
MSWLENIRDFEQVLVLLLEIIGAENGKRGYFLTFMIAYLRDFAFRFFYVAESFETSVSWKNVPTLCESVNR